MKFAAAIGCPIRSVYSLCSGSTLTDLTLEPFGRHCSQYANKAHPRMLHVLW